jgi:hypothetical protein
MGSSGEALGTTRMTFVLFEYSRSQGRQGTRGIMLFLYSILAVAVRQIFVDRLQQCNNLFALCGIPIPQSKLFFPDSKSLLHIEDIPYQEKSPYESKHVDCKAD